METMRKGTRCKGRTKEGKPCRAAATPGGLCYFHANPNQASELGRKGGQRRKSRAAAEGAALLPTVDNILAVRDRAARLIEDAMSGKVKPRDASSLVSLLRLLLLLIEKTEFERQMAEMRKEIAELKADLDSRKNPPPPGGEPSRSEPWGSSAAGPKDEPSPDPHEA